MSGERVWVNGEVAATVATTDRGLSYGDGLFETIRVIAGELSFEQLHWQRLMAGCQRLGIDLDVEQLKSEAYRFLRWSGADHGVVKVIITRGSGGRGYNPAGCRNTQRILSLYPLPVYPVFLPSRGVRVKLCQIRLGKNSLAGLKHLNRLEQVIARSEWTDSDCYEGLLLSFDDYLVEGTMSNIFLVDSHGVLLTPLLDSYGVAGVCRQYIINQASRWGLAVKEVDIPLAALESAKEVFVCNSVNGVWPVVSCDHFQWPVGAVTRLISDKVADVLNA